MSIRAKLDQAAAARQAEIDQERAQAEAAARAELTTELNKAIADLCASLHHEPPTEITVAPLTTRWTLIDGRHAYENTTDWLFAGVDGIFVAVRCDLDPNGTRTRALIKPCSRCHRDMAVRVVGHDGWIDAWLVTAHAPQIPCDDAF